MLVRLRRSGPCAAAFSFPGDQVERQRENRRRPQFRVTVSRLRLAMARAPLGRLPIALLHTLGRTVDLPRLAAHRATFANKRRPAKLTFTLALVPHWPPVSVPDTA